MIFLNLQSMDEPIIEKQLSRCHQNILPYIHNTPVITSNYFNEKTGAKIFFKCENFQKTGSFKVRGALNALKQLTEGNKLNCVVTHSSGNFAQALALAAHKFGIQSYIVMPRNAPQIKKEGVLEYGGVIIECEPTLFDRERTARRISLEKGATLVHPSNDLNIILGQATSCKELLEVHPNLDYVLTPVGGGGLVAGTIIAVKYYGKSTCRVIGGEPFQVDDAYRSLRNGAIESNSSTNTIADGLKTNLGEVNFPIIRDGIEMIVRVTEDEIVKAMRLVWERMKIIIEPSSAVAVAVLTKKKKLFHEKKIGVILSGGNIDVDDLLFRLHQNSIPAPRSKK